MTNQDNHKSISYSALEQTVGILKSLDEGKNLQIIMQDRGYSGIIHNTIYTLMRKKAEIDWILRRFSHRRIRPRLRRAMEWAAVQILYLQGVPAPLAVDCCVRFIKKRFPSYEANFVNALLREITDREPSEIFQILKDEAPMAVQLGLGTVLYELWEKQFSTKILQHIAEILQTIAPVTVRVRSSQKVQINDNFKNIQCLDWLKNYSVWELESAKDFFQSADYLANKFYIQDPSTLLAPAMLNVQPNERVADFCAAPGGKALCLAEALNRSGELVCLDRSERRLQRVRTNLAAFANVQFHHGSAAKDNPHLGEFDAILLDVPCSNSGVVRRRPDVRWNFSVEALNDLVSIQQDILEQSAKRVKQGGRMAYSTCSIESCENYNQTRKFLASHPHFQLKSERQLLPTLFHDGSYVAVMQRKFEE